MGYKDFAESLKDISATQLIEESAEKNWTASQFISKAAQLGLSKKEPIQTYAKILQQRANIDRTNKVEMEAQAQTPRAEAVLTGPAAQSPVGQGMTMPPGEVRQSGEITQDMMPAMKPKLTLPGRVGAVNQQQLMASMAGQQVGGQTISPEEIKGTATYQGTPGVMTDWQKEKVAIERAKIDLRSLGTATTSDLMSYRWARLAHDRVRLDLADEQKRDAARETLLEVMANYSAKASTIDKNIADLKAEEKKAKEIYEKDSAEGLAEGEPPDFTDRFEALNKQKALLQQHSEMFKELSGERTIPTGKSGGYSVGGRGAPKTAPTPAPKAAPAAAPKTPVSHYRTKYDY